MQNQTDQNKPAVPDFSFANKVSTATLVRLLVSKGILTTDEILKEERKIRPNSTYNNHASPLKKHHKIRYFVSHHRWLRKLTSKIFGWEFKKIQK